MEKRKQIEKILFNDYGRIDQTTVDKLCDLFNVVGRIEQLPNRCSVCGRNDEERLTMTSMCGVSACPY